VHKFNPNYHQRGKEGGKEGERERKGIIYISALHGLLSTSAQHPSFSSIPEYTWVVKIMLASSLVAHSKEVRRAFLARSC
jgi:hypothetical protein